MTSSTDLNQLHARLQQTRAFTAFLGVCVVVLAATLIWFVRRPAPTPEAIVLSGRDGTLILEPNRIELRGKDGRTTTLTTEDLAIGGHANQRIQLSLMSGIELVGNHGEHVNVHVGETSSVELWGGLHGGASVTRLEASDRGAELSLNSKITASTSGDSAHLEVSDGDVVWSTRAPRCLIEAGGRCRD